MTKNERYKIINDRFDERVVELHKLGFKRVHIEEYNVALYVCKVVGMKPHTIQASAISHADDFMWGEILLDATRYCTIWR